MVGIQGLVYSQHVETLAGTTISYQATKRAILWVGCESNLE